MPWMLVNKWTTTSEPVPKTTEPTTEATESTQVRKSCTVTVLKDDVAEQMDLEAYVYGVVLGEMSAEFEVEALKAQAVVARTFTMRNVENNGKHMTADVCTDPGCCQAYCDEGEYLGKGGLLEDAQKVLGAVEDTAGQVLVYNGELIEATYFSCSGGRTEDAFAVWGSDVPYLQATDSPGEEKAAHFTDTVTFTAKEFSQALSAELTGFAEEWIGPITYTDGGGVDTIQIGSKEYTGVELRKLLGLRSTAFSILAIGDTVTVTTRGFGHRVGMSQYGADAMALGGSDYRSILSHYYKGTVLTDIIDKTEDV